MNRTKIEYAELTWNPVTGCRHGCSYCWAERQVRRFQPSSALTEAELEDDGSGLGLVYEASRGVPWPFGWKPTLHLHRLDQPRGRRRPARIFVSDMGDLFGSWVPADWIGAVLEVIRECPQHRFLLLTRNPERYAEFDLPPNAWAGTTVTGRGDSVRLTELEMYVPVDRPIWVSYEPVLGPFPTECLPHKSIDWLVIGAQTGPGARPPRVEWLEEAIGEAMAAGVPVFLKGSLRPVWRGVWLEQYPEGLVVA